MFFVTYLRRELRRRMRQAVFIALGLALGVGLVIIVSAASTGVKHAQDRVLHALYGVGTDVTVTQPPPPQGQPGSSGGNRILMGPNGATINGKPAAGQTVDTLSGASYSALDTSSVAKVAGLSSVRAATGGLSLVDNRLTFPKSSGQGLGMPDSSSFSVQGVDIAHAGMGPYGNVTVTSGRSLASGDANADVAVVDSGYATSHKLKVGSTITIANKAFTLVGVADQPQSSNPPNAYIPLARAQALGTAAGKSLAGKVNTIYVTAASASDIPTVQHAISAVMPSATVTTSASLASQVSGSLKSTATLANSLGRWLSVLVLIAAFVVASLLTMAAVSRRVREFGTLKALGWRSRRIIAQVMGESVTLGAIGGLAGIAVGYGGAALITKIAPSLSATLDTPTGQQMMLRGPGGTQRSNPSIAHTVGVNLSATVTIGAIVLAVVLAVAGGLLAGSFGSWRIARLRPAAALARVA